MHPSTRVSLIEKGNMTNCGCEIESEGERSHDELIKLCKYLRATGAVQHPARRSSRREKGVEVDSLQKYQITWRVVGSAEFGSWFANASPCGVG